MKKEPTAIIRFHFFDFIFTPHKNSESSLNSKNILKQVITEINSERTKKFKAIVINRNEGVKDIEPRNLFVSSASYILKDKIYKCRIALIRDNKIPILVNKATYSLTPLKDLKDKAIAETTNFYIDMNGEVPVVCCEFNNHGPRISDIEYYFRYIASHNMLKISKACKASIHIKMPINEVLDSLKDVLKFNLKVRPNRLTFLNQKINDPFIGNMAALAQTVEPQSIRIESNFRKSNNSNTKNNTAIAFVKRVLKAVKKDNNIIENFEDFNIEFEKTDGTEDTFQLIKGKVEIIIKCPFTEHGSLDTKILFKKANDKFIEYLKNR